MIRLKKSNLIMVVLVISLAMVLFAMKLSHHTSGNHDYGDQSVKTAPVNFKGMHSIGEVNGKT